jgi:hypothetical protein
MALTIKQISEIVAYKNYEFRIYFSPQDFSESMKALNHLNLLNFHRYKFEYNITDHLPVTKGFYVFTIEDLGFPQIDFRYLLYIGKVEKTNTFRNRFYKYRSSINDSSSAENVMLLTNLWPDNTYVYVFELLNDHDIVDIEKILINKLKPNFNQEYFSSKTVNSTSLYQLANP